MPFFQGASDTRADGSVFNDVAGDQHNTQDRRAYAGHDRPSFKTANSGDNFLGPVTGEQIGGRNNTMTRTAPPIMQQQPQPHAPSLAVEDGDGSELLEVQFALTRAQHETRRHQKRADQLAAQLADAQAQIASLQKELAQFKRGGYPG